MEQDFLNADLNRIRLAVAFGTLIYEDFARDLADCI